MEGGARGSVVGQKAGGMREGLKDRGTEERDDGKWKSGVGGGGLGG